MDKKALRKQAFAYFKEMSDEVYLARTKEVLEFIMNDEKFLNAQKVGIYYPIHKEINLLILMELFPEKAFFFPRLEGHTLSFRQVKNIDELEPSKFNTRQPKRHHPIETDIDLYFVPCLLTYENYRIGHGKGYYDYYFKDHEGYKVGIVHKALKNIYTFIGPHDVAMDYII
ncbi:MAG: 5-formyltetrahydrofolate cyclo-ligase [Acholeplasmataceae bacterium]